MSYKYLTQFNSPNYTAGANARAAYGRPRTFEAIALHWWSDPATNPSFEGVVNHLCNPNSGVSAHFVATGTDRRVAQLVNFDDVSWATVQANPFTISIECDPRCRDEDYDVVAELIADIRSAYGNLPLVPHNKYFNTRCPGNWDLGRLDALANNKVSHTNFGEVTNKENLASTEQVQNLFQELLGRAADPGAIMTYTQQTVGTARSNIMASQEYHNRQQMISEQLVREAAEKAAVEAVQKAIDDAKTADENAHPVMTTPTPEVPPTPVFENPTPSVPTTTKKPKLFVLLLSAFLKLITRKKK